MSKQERLNETKTNLGDIEISPDVLEVISGIALSEVKGVVGTTGKWTRELTELFGQATYKKGVYLTLNEDTQDLNIDVYVQLRLGIDVPKTVREIQKNVKAQVLYMTNISLSEVNVHIVDLVDATAEKKSKTVADA